MAIDQIRIIRNNGIKHTTQTKSTIIGALMAVLISSTATVVHAQSTPPTQSKSATMQSTTLSKTETQQWKPSPNHLSLPSKGESDKIQELRSYLRAGSDALNQKEYEEAKTHFSRVITFDGTPDNFRTAALLGRAIAYQKMNVNNEALNDYEAILTNDNVAGKKRTVAFYNRGLIHRKNNNMHAAIKDFTHALLIEKRMAMAYFARADSRVKVEDFARAVKDYELARAYGYENPFLIHYGKAVAYERMDKKQDMIRELENALKLKPDHLNALNKYVQATGKEFQNAQISRKVKQPKSENTYAKSTPPTPQTVALKTEKNAAKSAITPTDQTRHALQHTDHAALQGKKLGARYTYNRQSETDTIPDQQQNDIVKQSKAQNSQTSNAQSPKIQAPKPQTPWMIQLSAQAKKEQAHNAWKKTREKYAPMLDAFEPVFMPAEVNGNSVWRVRISGFNSAGEAQSLCADLKKQGGACYAVRNN